MDVACPACRQLASPDVAPDGTWRCASCGAALAQTSKRPSIGRLALRRVTPGELMALDEPSPSELPVLQGEPATGELLRPAGPRFKRAIVAEDLELHRQLIADGLRERGLAEQVVATARGDRFLTAATDHLARGEVVDLALLDLEMPGLSGYHAAVALRAVEAAFGREPMAIVFFTARGGDARLEQALAELSPAFHVEKGAASEALFERLEQALRALPR